MLHLLIVDDEIHAVEGMLSALEWKDYQISSVFTAYSLRQAKEIFLENKIDIMICDIEMPNGSGLDLLTWVRERFPQTQSIFLTCHAEFPFIKKAMQLGSLDYFLKPITSKELEEAVRKAIILINKQNEILKLNEFAQYWVQHKSIIVERFWLDILNQNIPSKIQEIRIEAKERNIIVHEHQTLLPILIRLQKLDKEQRQHDKKIVEYALSKLAEEMFVSNKNCGLVLKWDEKRLLVIIDDSSVNKNTSFVKSCETYIQYCLQYFNCHVSCYIGSHVYVQQFAEMVGKLKFLEMNHVAFVNRVVVYGQSNSESIKINVPNMMVWAEMLKKGLVEKVSEESTEYLNSLVNTNWIDAKFLYQFYQDFLQMFYHVLKHKGIHAHQLFLDSKTVEMSIHATESLNGLIEWIQHIVKKAHGYISTLEDSKSIVIQVQTYILQNLEQDLSRDEIANIVHLNPDYLNRIFKKETGHTVSEFITKERIKFAKKLLTNTDLSITTVADSIGYTLPYFSKIFKKFTNQSPLEYRDRKICRI